MHSFLYNAVFYANPLICEFIEGLLLWRLLHNGIIRRYPCLAAYIFFDLIRTPALLAVAHLDRPAFAATYRATDLVALVSGFLLFYEIARSVFQPKTALWRVAWNALLLVGGLMFPAIWAFGWGHMLAAHFSATVALDCFEQYSYFARALLLLTIAALAQYYRVPLARNLRSLIFSFGPYLLVSAVGFASYHVFRTFAPYLELVPAATYTGMAAIWLWAFWEYSPIADAAIIHLEAHRSKAQWNHVWQSTLGAVRRGQN